MRPDLHFAPKDEPLREDVRTLGALVGRILTEQGGEELFARVEAARRSAIARRESGGGEIAGLEALTPESAVELVRAFSLYFQVINLAEDVHRIRRRRDYQRHPQQSQRGSFRDTVGRLRDQGVTDAELRAVLARLRVEPVFTAHPTEPTRRAILEKRQRIARSLIERLNPELSPAEKRHHEAHVRAEVTAIWQTEEQAPARPTVMDEQDHVLFYLLDVIYRIVPVLYEDFGEALADSYGSDAGAGLPLFLRFASWVGGDMDGNPNVTADTVRRALARQRRLILERYRQELGRLASRLTQTPPRVGVDPAVAERLAEYAARFPAAAAASSPRHADMPYRRLLELMTARLLATDDQGPAGGGDGYAGPDELLADLRLIAASLSNHRGERAGAWLLRRTLRRVETFGFHLATLDVRQDSAVHRRAVASLLGDAAWHERPAAERAALLRDRLRGPLPEVAGGDSEVEATLEVFRAIREAHARYGTRAIGPYVISMAQGADDVLSVLFLARCAGLVRDDGAIPLDVAPLFETVPDLQAAPAIMAELLQDPLYRAHLRRRDDHQLLMVGYSDSNKDGGITASRWALYEAQEELTRTLADAGVAMTIFHGRGGSVSRGGTKTDKAILAAPPGAVAGRLRVTEQGEMIDNSYSLRAIAVRTLERATGAVVQATVRPPAAPDATSAWRDALRTMARASRAAYRELVYGEGGGPGAAAFAGYFRDATPVDVIERLGIGSRPASRRSGGGIESLRAIPWVFAWTQSRHLLSGWYGLGTGLAAALREHGRDTVAEMVQGWSFFQVLLDDVEMVLAKADLGVARRYAALAGAAGEEIFPRIQAEFDRTVSHILDLKGNGALLDDDPTLQRAIRLRNPYVDPMSELQVDLLGRWRRGDRRDDTLLHALFATVRGIAYGLQNTG